jgi:hypothetical protein
MDNPIFHKLQEAVLNPSRSKEWFGLAEQAINTAYALGDHPDVLCNNLIKKLTVRAFTPRPKPNAEPASQPEEEQNPPAERDPDAMDEDHPESGDASRGSEDSAPVPEQTKEAKSSDAGDAFELSQLLFVVGHVAIKHIVYLELVEREWKRQKDEQDGGMCSSGFTLLWLCIDPVFSGQAGKWKGKGERGARASGGERGGRDRRADCRCAGDGAVVRPPVFVGDIRAHARTRLWEPA